MSETTMLWITGCLNVLAIIAAPIAALQIQRKLDEGKALKQRREQIFKALMGESSSSVLFGKSRCP